MSSVLIQFDLSERTVSYDYRHNDDYRHEDDYWCEVFVGFKLDDGAVLLSGCSLQVQCKDLDLRWPADNEVAVSTDQPYVVSGVVFAPPGDSLTVTSSCSDSNGYITDVYVVERDIPPSPFPSWEWSQELYRWIAPVPISVEEGYWYEWDEQGQSWVAHEIEQPTP
jgi:hypothetical protein